MNLRKVIPLLIIPLLAALALPLPAAADVGSYPEIISLPVGWQPEGIAVGYGHTFYSGSVATGAIYRGDLRTGEGEVFVQPQGHPAAGMKVDERTNTLYVSGGPSGLASIYDAASGNLLQTYQLSTETSFINDVIVTRDAAYFTNSSQAVFYRLPLGPAFSFPDPSLVQAIPLSGDWVQPQGFGANGIEATPNGDWLIIVNTNDGTLFRVNPLTGEATKIDLGGETVTFGDGLALRGYTLYVVRNQENKIAVVELNQDYTAGEVVDTITDGNFNVPTTIALVGNALYAVNARFGAPNPELRHYQIERVELQR